MASTFNPCALGWSKQKKEGLSAILQSSKASLEHEPIDYEDQQQAFRCSEIGTANRL